MTLKKSPKYPEFENISIFYYFFRKMFREGITSFSQALSKISVTTSFKMIATGEQL
jgi:hypothetical protein